MTVQQWKSQCCALQLRSVSLVYKRAVEEPCRHKDATALCEVGVCILAVCFLTSKNNSFFFFFYPYSHFLMRSSTKEI